MAETFYESVETATLGRNVAVVLSLWAGGLTISAAAVVAMVDDDTLKLVAKFTTAACGLGVVGGLLSVRHAQNEITVLKAEQPKGP